MADSHLLPGRRLLTELKSTNAMAMLRSNNTADWPGYELPCLASSPLRTQIAHIRQANIDELLPKVAASCRKIFPSAKTREKVPLNLLNSWFDGQSNSYSIVPRDRSFNETVSSNIRFLNCGLEVRM